MYLQRRLLVGIVAREAPSPLKLPHRSRYGSGLIWTGHREFALEEVGRPDVHLEVFFLFAPKPGLVHALCKP